MVYERLSSCGMTAFSLYETYFSPSDRVRWPKRSSFARIDRCSRFLGKQIMHSIPDTRVSNTGHTFHAIRVEYLNAGRVCTASVFGSKHVRLVVYSRFSFYVFCAITEARTEFPENVPSWKSKIRIFDPPSFALRLFRIAVRSFFKVLQYFSEHHVRENR